MDEDKEFIEFIRRSREQVGEEEPVILTEDGRVVDGKHRLEAYPGWRKVVVKLSPKEALIKRIHRTLKGKVSLRERKAQILELALHLEDEGVKKQDMITELSKLVPFHEDYLRRLLPKKYKREYKPRVVTVKKQFRPKVEIVQKPEVAKAEREMPTCPHCHMELTTILCPKCWKEIGLKEVVGADKGGGKT